MTQKWDFWNGPDEQDRREKYAKDFKPEYQANGDEVQRRIEAVVTAFRAETQIDLPEGYASGWRPAVVNEATANAGKTSAHVTAEAGDKRDTADGAFAWWCTRHEAVLAQHGLYMEHPVATVVRAWRVAQVQGREPTPWCHLTTRAPASHTRVYWPDAKALGEFETFKDAGGEPGMAYAAWTALRGTPIEETDKA